MDAELSTLEDEDEDDEELASMELRVDARLCLEAVRRSMLSGRSGAARPGLSVAVADAANDDDLGEKMGGGLPMLVPMVVVGLVVVEEDEAAVATQRRPRNREAAVVTSAVRAAFGSVPHAICSSRYPLFERGKRFSGDDAGEAGEVLDEFVGVVVIAVPEAAREEQLHDILQLAAGQNPTLVLLHERQRHAHDCLRSALGKDHIVDAKQHG